MILILLVSLFAYFLGSIPFGLILSKKILNIDIRKLGSKNIGATNILRISCVKLGFLTLLCEAQAPHTFSYQTVIRDANWQPRVNETIHISASISADSPDNFPIYREEHFSVTTNAIGLVNLAIGGGQPTPTSSFSNIDWGNHTHFLTIGIAETSSTNSLKLSKNSFFSLKVSFIRII